MSSTPQDTELPLRTLDRRVCARRSVASLAYIDLGEKNGGIILNLSEGGLAVTAAAPLDTDAPARMRFQLPGSSDRLSACGEIIWISESRKEVGLRFVDLSEDVRSRITAWISQEPSPARLDREKAAAFAENERSARLATAPCVKNAIAELVETSQAATQTDRHSEESQETLRSGNASDEPPVSDNLRVDSALESSDRRAEVRRSVPSLAYIDLGENNGGIILNLSEGGLAVTSAAPLYADGPTQLQFQLPGSSDWMKVGAEIAWVSKSKREAGLRFLELPNDARDRMGRWLSCGGFESEGAGSREKLWRPLEMPTVGIEPTPAPATDAPAVANLVAEVRRSRTLWKHAWGTLATIVALAALTSFLAGWFTAVPDSLTRTLARFEKATPKEGEPVSGAGSPSAGSVTSASGPSAAAGPADAFASKDGDSISPSVGATPVEEAHRDLAPSDGTRGVGALAPTVTPEHVRKPTQSTVASSPSTAIPVPASPVANQPVAASNTAVKESVLPAKPAETPPVARPSFSVSLSPYPSVRVPAGFKSQQGARLEIGQLLSRVDPVYPEDAKTQRIEGTVRLHVLIGPDGSVQSVEPISGPALLIPAAANAVRQWRYTNSSIGDLPVAIEEDVAIAFRLPTQATPN